MSDQHDFVLADQAGVAFLADLNLALLALAKLSDGTAAPATTYAFQLWADTTNNVLKQRNAANSGWLVRGSLQETFVKARSSNTILAAADMDAIVHATSSFTQTLTAAATLGDGWKCWYFNTSTGTITLDPNSTETINGATTLDIPPGHGGLLRCNGTAFLIQLAPTMDNGQIKFPATQNASSDANTLDDYEEGTWTPSVGGSATYTGQAGRYTKIGRKVTCNAYFEINAIGTGSTTTISGLPFSVGLTGYAPGNLAYFSNLVSSVVWIAPQATGTSITFATLAAAAAASTNSTAVFKNGTRMDFDITFEV